MSSPITLSTLSAELHLLISDQLTFADRLNFASVSSHFRALLVPKLFSGLRFTNREADADSIKLVIDKYSKYVQKLSFECYLYPDTFDEDDDDDDSEPSAELELEHFPQWTRDLLSGKTLKKPRTIEVKLISDNNFEPDGDWGDDEGLGGIYIASYTESHDQIIQKEREFIWRNALRQLWDALSNNESITHLEISNLVAREVSSWSTDGWKAFLARLHTLSIELWGDDNGAGWKTNTCGGYLDFLANLDRYFLNDTTNLKHLKIKAYEDSVYGTDGHDSTRLALRPKQMPYLEVLELEDCVIDPNLIEFLRSHASSLHQLVLRNCASRLDDGLAMDTTSWETFFRELCAMKPFLTNLEVINYAVSLCNEETWPSGANEKSRHMSMTRYVPPDNEAENIKAIRRAVKEGERRLFRHIRIDDKYGMIFEVPELNIERFEAGDDQREYDRLMSLIARNARGPV